MKEATLKVLHFYKRTVSPLLVNLFGEACRFTPTCSQYTIDAVTKRGVLVGLWMGFKRFIKCNPLSRPRYDPVS